MAKQLNVNLAFTADTGKAKAQLKDLQNQLTNLINTTKKTDGLGINDDLEKSVKLAAELQAHLNAATNEKTGNLDFSKLNESLKQSGKSLTDYSDSLRKMGKDGYRAFQLLASSVVASEVPIRRANDALNELWVTMKNTMRWQLTSSAMHSFMGAISSAYGYAKNLNESLNNIRIVSGASTEEMAKFAEEANKAAKALSTTTTDYTNAALIYYQQGLSDDEIKRRTDITIKMANVTRDSAEIVSDQLTAVWNNFYKEGGKSLNYYADVMTALGAATASSTDEIAGGLEKFASIADMIGLSFDYAATSLATITATTRQSEEVVGTALKTIFARIQGLKLGETLEDGTDLNKYSDSLKRVGIDIFDTTGELKDMDNILDEIGARWESLAKSEQVALAQAVAGIRQYNQLVSLMDNWDYFQENLGVARSSSGTLDEQAEIYAESWEAARDRVTAALESIYSDILKDDVFIEALDAIGNILEMVDKFVDSVGGLQGVLTGLGIVITRVFKEQLASSLKNAAYNMQTLTISGREKIQDSKRKQINKISQINENDEYETIADKARAEVLRNQLKLQDQLLSNSSKMSEIELEQNRALIERSKLMSEIRIKQAEQLDQIKEERGDAYFEAKVAFNEKNNNLDLKERKKNEIAFNQNYRALSQVIPVKENISNSIKEIKELETFEKRLNSIKQKTDAIKDTKFQQYISSLKQADLEGEDLENTLSIIVMYLEELQTASIVKLEGLVDEQDVDKIHDLVEKIYAVEKATKDYTQAEKDEKIAVDHTENSIKNTIGIRKNWADQIVNCTNVIMTFAMGVSSAKAALDAWNNPDLTGWEKIETIIMSGAMALATFVPLISSTFTALKGLNIQTVKNTAALWIYNTAVQMGIIGHAEDAAAITADTIAWNANTAAILRNILMRNKKLLIAIGVAIAAIKLITWGINEWTEAYDKNANEAESAAEATEILTKRYEELRDEALKFKEAISNYEEGIKSLSELEKGTTEYTKALEKANEETKQLIEAYDLWGKASYDENGILKIDSEALKEAEAEYEAKERHAQSLSQMAEIRKQQSSIDNEATKARREFNANVGYNEFVFNDDDFIEVANLIQQAKENSLETGRTIESEFKKLTDGTSYRRMTDVIFSEENIKIFESFYESTKKAQEATDYYTGELLKSNVEDAFGEKIKSYTANDSDEGYDKVQYNLAVNAASAMALRENDEYRQAIQDINVQSINQKNLSDKYEEYADVNTNEELIRTYADLILQKGNELDNYEYKNGQLIDSKGNSLIDESVTFKEMAQSLAQLVETNKITDEYAKEIENQSEKTGSVIEQGKKFEEEYGVNSSNIILSELINNKGEISLAGLFKELSPTEIEELLGLNNVELANKLGLSPELIKQMGFTGLNDFYTKAQESLNKYKESDYSEPHDNAGELKAKELGIDLEEFKSYRNLLIEQNKEYRDNRELANDIAITNKRMEKGVKELAKEWEDYNKVMSDSASSNEDISTVLADIKPAIQDILNLNNEDFELLPENFAKDNWNLIQDVMNGVEGSIDTLRDKAGESILLKISADTVDLDKDGKIDQAFIELHNKIAEFNNTEIKDIEIGAVIDKEKYAEFYASCQNLVNTAKMSSEEAQRYFGAMGYDVEFDDNPQTVQEQVVEHEYSYDYDDETGEPVYRYVKPIHKTVEATIDAPTIKTITPNGSYGGYADVQTTAPKAARTTKSGSGGGSKAKATKVKKTKKSDVVERYKEINDVLDDLTEELEDINKLTNRLYGANKIKQLEKEAKILLQQKEALEEKRKQAEKYLKLDKQALELEGKKHGISFKFDAQNNIINYTEEMSKLFTELETAENKMNSFTSKDAQEKYEESTFKPIQEKIEALKEVIKQYDETRELLEDLDNEIDDKFYEWQDNNYEKLTYSLELKLEINDMELERLDYFLNKFSDNFYKMAESASLMLDQINPNKEKLENNKDAREELDAKYKAGEISQADYIEGLKNVRQNIYDTLEALNELDKTMLHYYEDTLAAASEELADHTDHLEHLTSVFDHYINLMNILGKSKNYDAIGDFLGGKADTIRDRLNVAQEYYDMLLEQKEDTEIKLNAAIARGDDAAIELYKEEWDAIIDAVDEAQEQVLSLTEEWAEAMKAVIENNMAEIAETLEKTLTGGLNFEELMNGFDKLNTRQEEYLTKTNQIYETNKLMRTANKALDETDNVVAKTKLKNFIEETKSLQQNTKLSEYELEIQQAKYDLLLAEIALEEAQNAKSTVRLSRDNEGNFGYVYTADQDAVDDAQQNVEDAENRLYNISLEGQQEYTEKYLQAQQEMYNELTELQQMYLDGQIASEEEYERRKEEILNHYLNPEDGILSTYSRLYNIAVQTDADATADYWAKDYAQMTQNTEEWRDAVNEYLVKIEEETEVWRDVSEQANRDVQNALEDSSEATEELTDESKKLANELKRTVVPAIEQELKWVAKQTEAYANQRKELLALIKTMEEYARQMQKDIEGASSFDPDKDYAYSMISNAASGNMEAAEQDITERVYKVAVNGGNYDSASGQKLINAINALSSSEKQSLLRELEAAKASGYTSNSINQILKNYGISAYATGGYTGAWGPEGKLAVLHEKELVLNADDTSNLLTVVSFVRDLVNLIDGQAQMASLTSLSAASNIHSIGQTLEQSVSIHAEFPNATDRYEIEEAFNSLVNRASQYANRK